MANKSIVLSVRISDSLNEQLDYIAEQYHISVSHLVNAVLTSFCLEYSNQLIEKFSPDENAPAVE